MATAAYPLVGYFSAALGVSYMCANVVVGRPIGEERYVRDEFSCRFVGVPELFGIGYDGILI